MTASKEPHRIVEVECGSNRGFRQWAFVWKDSVSNVVATWYRYQYSIFHFQTKGLSIPMSALASGAFGERRRERRIMLPQVAKPYFESLRMETPTKIYVNLDSDYIL